MVKEQLLVIGNIQADLLMGNMASWPEMGTETILPHSDWRPGGSAGNTALALKEFNQDFSLLSSVGSDEMGKWLKEVFSFCASKIPASQTATTISVGVIHDDDERTFLTSQGHLEVFSISELLPTLSNYQPVKGFALLSGVFLSAPLIDQYETLIDKLNSLGYQIGIDPGWPSIGWDNDLRNTVWSWFDKCQHILINDKEAMALTEKDSAEVALNVMQKRLSVDTSIIIKNGAKGVLASRDNQSFCVPAPTVSPVDTVGAGDCFNAGYVWAIHNKQSLENALAMGVTTASLAISSFPRKYPSLKDVKSMAASTQIKEIAVP